MDERTLRVAVLMGGISDERDVSIKSGRAVADALERYGYDVSRIMINSPSVDCLDADEVDMVFIALHGRFGEDGAIQALLEERGIPYTGSGPEASSMGMDKIASKATFCRYHIPTPPYIEVHRDTPIEEIRDFQLPLVVKPAAQGSSVGITLVRKLTDIEPALNTAFKQSETVIVERLIDGQELTVGILGEKPLPVIEIVPKTGFYDYNAKYERDDTQYIINGRNIDEEMLRTIQRFAIMAHKAIGCRDFSRVDLMLSRNRVPYVLEVNTIPGFTDHSLLPKAAKAIGLSFEELCHRIVELAYARASRQASEGTKKVESIFPMEAT